MRSVRSRLLAVLVAALAVLGTACAEDGELGGPAVGGSSAAVVGDSQLSHGELSDLVDDWASNPEFLAVATSVTDVGEPGRRPAALVNFALNFWLQSEQGRLSVGDEATAASEAQSNLQNLTQQFPTFGDFDESFQMVIAEALSHQNALVTAVNQGVPVDVPGVEVSSRYGSTNELPSGVVGVDPPTGPLPEPGDAFGL